MPTDYNQDYNSFSDLAAQNQINESFLSRWKFNPVRHPIAYATRLQLLTRLGHTTRAIGYGGFYSPGLFRGLKPLVFGLPNSGIITRLGLGGLYSALSIPSSFGSFAVRTFLFSNIFGKGGIPGTAEYITKDIPLINDIVKFVNKGIRNVTGERVFRPGILGGMVNEGIIGPSFLRELYSINRTLPSYMFVSKDIISRSKFGRIYGKIVSQLTNKLTKIGEQAASSKLYVGIKGLASKTSTIKTPIINAFKSFTDSDLMNVVRRLSKSDENILFKRETWEKLYTKYKNNPNKIRDLVNWIWRRSQGYIKENGYFEHGLLPVVTGSASDLYKKIKKWDLDAGKLSNTINKYNDAVVKTYGGVNEALAKRGLLYEVGGNRGLRNIFLGKYNQPFERTMFDILNRTFTGIQASVGRNSFNSFINSLAGAFNTPRGLGLEYAKGLSNLVLGQYTQNLMYGALPRGVFSSLWREFKYSIFKSSREQLFNQFVARFQDIDFSKISRMSDNELIRLLRLDTIKQKSIKVDRVLNNFRESFKKVMKNNGKLTSSEIYKLASESYSQTLAKTERLAMGSAMKLFVIGKIVSKVGGAAIEGAVNAADNLISTVSRITHLDFGTGRALTTRMASTERVRALQAIQYSGLNARSYLGQESQIYAGAY